MSIHNRLRNMVVRRLSTEGRDAVGRLIMINRVVQGVYNTETSSIENTIEVYKTSGIRVAIKQYFVDGTLVKDEDVNFYVSPVCIKVTEEIVPGQDGEAAEVVVVETPMDTPKILPSDTIEFDGESYVVVTTNPWNHSGLSAGYKIHGRVAN